MAVIKSLVTIVALFFGIVYGASVGSIGQKWQNGADVGTTENSAAFTIYHNGNIITMAGPKAVYVQSVVVHEGKIVYVGTYEEARKRFGKNAESFDLKEKTMLPGFIDAHAHFGSFSAQAIGAHILPPPDAGASTIPELLDILRDWNTKANRKLTGWIFGMGFDDSVLAEKRFPTKHDLDEVSTEHPIMIIHISGHFAVVNTEGLRRLEITKETPDPDGGIIRRENGKVGEGYEPNGVLEELAAIPRYGEVLKPSSLAAGLMFFKAGQDMALSYGYTTAHEGRAFEDNHDMLANVAKHNMLKLDVVSYIDYNVTMFNKEFMDSQWKEWYGPEYKKKYRIGGMKLTLDGSPQGRTAWRTIPYVEAPEGKELGYLGYPAIEEDSDVEAIYKQAFDNNWQIITHANGDAAMDQMIRTMQKVSAQYEHKDRRNVLIHGQYIRDDQLDAFKELDVIASLFPLHTYYWGDWHKEIIGDDLGNHISPTRTALDKGLRLTIHTDAPVALPNLMRMVGITVERKSRSGAVIGEEEKLTAYEALKAITIWSAYQHFEDETKGTIEEGKLADFVILNQNPLAHDMNEAEIKEIEVLKTIKEGKVVYTKPAN